MTGEELYRKLSPGDFAEGQRTMPKKAVVPHGTFARGRGDGDVIWSALADKYRLWFTRKTPFDVTVTISEVER